MILSGPPDLALSVFRRFRPPVLWLNQLLAELQHGPRTVGSLARDDDVLSRGTVDGWVWVVGPGGRSCLKKCGKVFHCNHKLVYIIGFVKTT